MSNMVYLLCSLPSLNFAQVPPISLDEFYHDAEKQLSSKHFSMLERVDLRQMDSDEHGKLKDFAQLYQDLLGDITELRTAKTEKRPVRLAHLPKSLADGNPLEREKQIMRWQWDRLDDLEAGNTFSLVNVLVYKLRLQILDRLQSMEPERGSQVFESVINDAKTKG